jgi:endonuclease/exonuclease/phosphatase family metal-dependent hydrolase
VSRKIFSQVFSQRSCRPGARAEHLVLRLNNAVAAQDVCVVHLGRTIGNGGVEKQRNQCRALLRWAMWNLSGDPNANLVIMGDFNEGQPVGSDGQLWPVCFRRNPG